MTELRTLHEFSDRALVERVVAAAAELRDGPGCTSAEVYRTLMDEHHWALTTVWESESAFAAAWARVVDGDLPALDALAAVASSEFYVRAPYVVGDGRWVPEGTDAQARRIAWPARGEIRIIIQNAYADEPTMRALTRAEIAETRREPGCLAYAWMEHVELPNHLILLEHWADQLAYDHHWFGRMRSVELRGDSGRRAAAPERGPVAREFYRRQPFTHQYGRWQPAELADYSETIVWGAG